jgi:hypothetical protein
MEARMISSLATRLAPARRITAKAAAFGGLGLAVLLVSTAAQAQFYDYGYGYGRGPYYGDDDYPGPGGDYPGPRSGYPNRPPPRADISPRATLSLADIRQHAEQHGLRLIATPRRKGRIYLAEAEDTRGLRHRLVFDAYEGRLLENTVLNSKNPPTEKPMQSGEPSRPHP